MKKIIATFMASACLIGTQAAAHTPPALYPAAPWTLQGTLVVNKGVAPPLTCIVTMNLTGADDSGDGVSASHTDMNNVTATITLAAGDAGCPTIIPSPVAAPKVTYDVGTNLLTLEDLYVQTITLGNCAGTISGEWIGTGLVLDDVVLPEDTAGGDCHMTGYLGLVTPGSGSIAP